MGEGIFSITAKDLVVELRGQGKEQTLNRLLNTGRVSFNEFVEGRCCARRAITAVASATSAIPFDVILPMLAEDDGGGRSGNGVTIHAKSMKLVELFEFAGVPERPCIKLFEFATSEVSKRKLGISGGLRTNGM